MPLLARAARYGRSLLIVGLLVGVFLPEIAALVRPFLQELVALLLVFAALRIRPDRISGVRALYLPSLGLVLIYQLALPVSAALISGLMGVADNPVAMAIVLMLAAPSISGGPHIAVMSGADPAPALRLLVLGTALLPLTIIPVFALMPDLGNGSETIASAGRLLAVIIAAAILSLAVRKTILKNPTAAQIATLDGLSAILMAVVVVGLMTAVGPALRNQPAELFSWLALAFFLNFGLQFATLGILHRKSDPASLPARSIVAGNRNIALFLVALPPDVSDKVLIFIGCYQVPMYLTPMVMTRIYARWARLSGEWAAK